jgi:hypothetical protein
LTHAPSVQPASTVHAERLHAPLTHEKKSGQSPSASQVVARQWWSDPQVWPVSQSASRWQPGTHVVQLWQACMAQM